MMLFDGFPSRDRANAFAGYVAATYEREVHVWDTDAEARAADPFPFLLLAPVVHVSRLDDDDDNERAIEESVAGFGGRFAGT